MRHLYLVRHATPTVQPTVPSPQWQLSDRGIDEARRLARVARAWGLRALYTSSEPKAQQTALIIGDALALPPHAVEGLQETRLDVWIDNSDEFGDAVRQVLQKPDMSFRGAERAEAAAARFADAVAIIAAGALPAAVVTHGRIMAAWLSHAACVEDPYPLWRSIPMPGWTRVDLDDLRAESLEPFRAEGGA